jgi:PD-(D/E)XK nuclease superfamily
VLDRALRVLENAGALAAPDTKAVEDAVAWATREVAADWESERPVPPAIIWQRTLDDADEMASRALSYRARSYSDKILFGGRSYGEVPFGGSKPKSEGQTPWDPAAPVTIPKAGFNIAGYIDRLDISGDGKRALVCDYKTGRPPRGNIRLNGGRELQRCLYAFAVKALLGDNVAISASLLYPRELVDLQLDDPETVLAKISGYLCAAKKSLSGGAALLGPDTGGSYDELAFALPANASATYCKRKLPAATELMGEVTEVWEAE